MARKRMISPQVWQDPDFGKLSPEAKVMFFGLISNADDEGRLRGNPAYLKSIVFVYENYTNARIEKIRNEVLCTMHNAILYTVNGEEYIQLKSWKKYQKIRDDRIVPSEFPSPKDGQVSDICPADDGQLPAQYRLGKYRLGKYRLGKYRLENTLASATPNPKIKQLIDFFFRATQAVQGIKPVIDGGKVGTLLKKKLEKDEVSSEKMEMYILWYLSRKKRYQDSKGNWLEKFKNTPDFAVMLSSSRFNELLSDEKNAISFMQENYAWADRVYGQAKSAPGSAASIKDLLKKFNDL